MYIHVHTYVNTYMYIYMTKNNHVSSYNKNIKIKYFCRHVRILLGTSDFSLLLSPLTINSEHFKIQKISIFL